MHAGPCGFWIGLWATRLRGFCCTVGIPNKRFNCCKCLIVHGTLLESSSVTWPHITLATNHRIICGIRENKNSSLENVANNSTLNKWRLFLETISSNSTWRALAVRCHFSKWTQTYPARFRWLCHRILMYGLMTSWRQKAFLVTNPFWGRPLITIGSPSQRIRI